MNSLQAIGAPTAVFLDLATVTATPTGSDAFLPGKGGTVVVALINNGGAQATNVKATLTSSSPFVTITQASATYPTLPSGASAANATPFAFSLSSTTPCGGVVDFTLTASFTGRGTSPTVFHFSVQTGRPTSTSITTAYAGAPVPIPDDDLAGVDIPLAVTGVGPVSKAVFRLDGTSCSTDVNSPTVGIAHTWAGDVIARLTAPNGRSVIVINQAGGALNGGNNFCQTVLDDAATSSIQTVSASGAPWTGTFTPANPLAAFTGANADGTWVLNVADAAFLDTGTVEAFSLTLSGFSCE